MRRLEWMAVGWGGLVAAIGLLAGAERGEATRVASVAVAFLLGGFLAGVRAEQQRPLHAAVAAVGAYLFYGAFVVLGHAADLAGGPSAPKFLPGSNARWGIVAALAIAFAIVGGIAASVWLRPGRRDQHRRRTV